MSCFITFNNVANGGSHWFQDVRIICCNNNAAVPNEAVAAHALHMSTDAMIVVVPVLAACLRLRAGSFLGGKKKGTGNNRGVGGVWNSAHRASCQSRSCARSADKEGESVLAWAGVQSNLRRWRWSGWRGVQAHVWTQGGGLNGQQRHRGQLFIPAKTKGHSSIWDSIHPTTAKIFKASILDDLDFEAVPQKSEILTSPFMAHCCA